MENGYYEVTVVGPGGSVLMTYAVPYGQDVSWASNGAPLMGVYGIALKYVPPTEPVIEGPTYA